MHKPQLSPATQAVIIQQTALLTAKITAKESLKNKEVEDAHRNELIKQSENRSKISQFFVDWLIVAIKVVSGFVTLMLTYHVSWLVQNPIKLEYALVSIYAEIKHFVVEYQSVIAVVGTLILGDKFKSKGKN